MNFIKKLNITQYSIFSYIFFFALIFIPMSLVWYATSKQSVLKQVELSSKNILLQSKASFESDLSQLDMLAQQLPYDSAISLSKLADPYETIASRSALLKYRLNNAFIEQIYLFYPEDQTKLYSPNGSTEIKDLLDLRGLNVQKEDFITFLNQSMPIFSSIDKQSTNERTFFYSVPTTDSFGAHQATMLFIIKKAAMDNLFAPLSDSNHQFFYLIDANQQALSFSRQAPALINRFENQSVAPIKIKQGNETFIVQTIENSGLQLRYLAIVNIKVALAKIAQVYKWSIYLILAVLIIGLIVSLFLARQSLQPYKKIESLLLKYDKENPHKHSLSFEDIHYKVSNYLSENNHLKDEMTQQKPFIKESLLHQLLTGQLNHLPKAQSLFQSSMNATGENIYFSVVISLEEISETPSSLSDRVIRRILQQLNRFKQNEFEWFGTKCIGENALTLLVATKNDFAQTEILDTIAEALVELCGVALPIGVGTTTSDLLAVKHSFIEALAALNYRYKNTNQMIYYYSDMPSGQTSACFDFSFPEDKQLKLVQSLTKGNETVALETLEELIQYGLSHCETFQLFRMYSYFLINTYANFSMVLHKDQLLQELEILIDVNNYQTLALHLQTLTKMICIQIEAQVQTEESDLKAALFDYIEQEYNSDLLTLESLSDLFSLSPTTINKMMKEETNTTFAKYVANIRMEKIKQALIETDDPIKEIIQSNGYYDVSNFTRKFRQVVGVTAGQFRTIHR